MKIKIVTDGTSYAIKRKDFFFSEEKFFDLKDPGYWWSKKDANYNAYLGDCWGDKQTVEMWFKRLTS